MIDILKLGFIGMGEASFYLSKDLKSEQVTVFAYDKLASEIGFAGDIIRERALKRGITLVMNMEELFVKSEVIMCLTSATSALPISREIKPLLEERHFYADLNSASPKTEKQIAEVLADTPARFTDIGVMAPVPSWGTKVPLVACGKDSKILTDMLNNIGMNVEYMGEEIGTASMFKMNRSMFMKGFVALMCETVFAASQYNIVDEVLESIRKSLYDEKAYLDMVNMHLTGMVPHSKRFVHEMKEALDTLEDLGENSIMTQATVKKMQWFTDEGFLAQFASKGIDRPASFMDIVAEKNQMKQNVEG